VGLAPTRRHAAASRPARDTRLAAIAIALTISLACGILVAAVVMLTYQAAAQIIMAQGG
jgi:hypothetical protein